MFKTVKPKDPDLYVVRKILRYADLFSKSKRCFNLALAGGKTPLGAYSILAKDLKVKAFLSDERYVPLTDTKSNYKNVRDTGLDLYPFPTYLDITECALEYSNLLPDYLDFALLGIGDDGHTASLFPDVECEEVTPKVCISSSPDGLKRLSLSYEYLNSSCIIAFFVKGKENIIRRMLEGEDMPANRVKGKRQTLLIWSLD